MHLAQGKTPGTRNEMLQGNESTNATNLERYFLARITPRSTSRLCRTDVSLLLYRHRPSNL